MRRLVGAALVVVALSASACASKESLRALDEAREQVKILQSQIEKELAQPGFDSTVLVAQLEDAIKKRDDARAKVESEKSESRAAVGTAIEKGAETALNGLLPGLGQLLVVAAGAIRGIADKKASA